MVLRLCVPLIHWLLARNWNLAASGWALTASRVANSVGTSTPLRGWRFSAVMVVIAVLLVMSPRPGRPRGDEEATSAVFHSSSSGGKPGKVRGRPPPEGFLSGRARRSGPGSGRGVDAAR